MINIGVMRGVAYIDTNEEVWGDDATLLYCWLWWSLPNYMHLFKFRDFYKSRVNFSVWLLKVATFLYGYLKYKKEPKEKKRTKLKDFISHNHFKYDYISIVTFSKYSNKKYAFLFLPEFGRSHINYCVIFQIPNKVVYYSNKIYIGLYFPSSACDKTFFSCGTFNRSVSDVCWLTWNSSFLPY